MSTTQQHPGEGTGVHDASRSPSGGPFLLSKLEVPPHPASWVPRERLHARLTTGVRGPLTVLSAPAGAGKTLLVASWAGARAAPGPVVWLTLDEDDDEPETFWFSVLYGLHHAGVDMSCTSGAPSRPASVDHGFLAQIAGSFAEHTQPVVLVIDEFDMVGDRRVADGLEFVLRRSGHGLRLVLLGRRDPLLPLHRYRVRDELTEIRSDDLALTRSETGQMLDAHGVSLSEQAVTALLERTEGWVVGVRLTAMAVQSKAVQSKAEQAMVEESMADRGGRADGETFVAEFAADDTTIADYLVGEVLDAQPHHVRDLLLCTSVAERVHPDLADVLSGSTDSARTLATLERGNAFVSHIPSAPGWYRYHRLFRDVLRAQLAYESPELVSDLNRRAAQWLARRHLIDEAVAHAATAGEWSLACSLAVDRLALPALLAGRTRMAEVLSAMPDDEPGPETALVRAALALSRKDLDRCAAALEHAESALVRARPLPRPSIRLSVALLCALLARLRGDALLAVAAARRARALLRDIATDSAEQPPEVDAVLASVEGSALTWVGDFSAAERVLNASAPSPNGRPAAAPVTLGDLALVETVRGHLRRGGQLGRRAVDAGAGGSGAFASQQAAAGRLALTWVAVEEYDLNAARRDGELAARAAAEGHDALLSAGLALVRARLLRVQGDWDAAHDSLVGAFEGVSDPHERSMPPTWLARQVTLAEASVHSAVGASKDALTLLEPLADDSAEYGVAIAGALLAAGDERRARAALRPVLDRSDGTGARTARVEGWLLHGRMLAEAGDVHEAGQAAGHALRLARPERLRRPFAEEHGWLRYLFRQDAALAEAHAWLGPRLLPHPRSPDPIERTDASAGDAVLVEPLSAREGEVLALLAQMMSTEEIASALFLSHNTVKTHLKSIYRKLSASRRGEAVRRARRLGLL